jgi:hypothetical protein
MWAKAETAMRMLEDIVSLLREIRDELRERRGAPSV